MAKNVKKRNWAFILYPESAPDDWLDHLQKSGLLGCASPLHDKDVDDTGKPKKAHRHVILCYPGPTTYNAVKSLCDTLNSAAPQPLESVRGYYRYLTHEDNPEKAHYAEEDIITFGGFDISDYVEMTKSEVLAALKELQTKIRDCEIFEYSDLLDFLLDNDMSVLYDVATSHTIMLSKYIDSRRNKLSSKKDNT